MTQTDVIQSAAKDLLDVAWYPVQEILRCALDDEIKALDDEIKALDDEIEALDDEIEALDDEIKTASPPQVAT